MNPMLQNAGNEPKVVGAAFATGANKMSAPIEGNTGVFVVQPIVITKAPALKDHSEYAAKVKGQVAGYSNRIIPALKKDADIEDNRFDFN